MSRLLVDSRTLRAVEDALGRLHDQLVAMPAVLRGFDGMLGGHALETDLEAFCGRWHLGILEIGGEVAEMIRRLAAAAAAYQRIEDGIAAKAKPRHFLTGSGTTVIPPPRRPARRTGSGTTTIAPGASRPAPKPPARRPAGGVGSGTTTIEPGPARPAPKPPVSGSGTTVID